MTMSPNDKTPIGPDDFLTSALEVGEVPSGPFDDAPQTTAETVKLAVALVDAQKAGEPSAAAPAAAEEPAPTPDTEVR